MEEMKLPRGSTQPRERGQPGWSSAEREGSVKVPRCRRKKGRLKKVFTRGTTQKLRCRRASQEVRGPLDEAVRKA